MPNDPSTEELALAVTTLAARMTHRLEQRLAVHGVALSEYLVMRLLSDAPDRTMRRTDLADGVNMTPSGVTRMLLPMEKNRIVTREANERDARVSLVRLTKTGERLFHDATASFRHGAEMFFEPLTVSQIERFTGLVRTIIPEGEGR